MDGTYHSLCYTDCGALAKMRNILLDSGSNMLIGGHHSMRCIHIFCIDCKYIGLTGGSGFNQISIINHVHNQDFDLNKPLMNV